MNDHIVESGGPGIQQGRHEVGQGVYFDFMIVFKVIFYLIFIIKIVELSFLRRKKYSLKQRIYRKFLFAHQELLRHFTDEDKSMMETTLSNTMKNANIDYDPKNSKIRRPIKRVNFQTQRNDYYDPKKWREEEIDDKRVEERLDLISSTFQEKKLEDEFGERQDLLGLDDKEEELLPLQSQISIGEGRERREVEEKQIDL